MFGRHDWLLQQEGTVENEQRQVAYWELHERLEGKVSRPAECDIVVLSNVRQGSQTSAGIDAVSIRYVARGVEDYRIAGRGYRLQAGQVMIAPHRFGADCEVRSTDRRGTLGICTLVHCQDDFEWPQAALIQSAECTGAGKLLQKTALALSRVPTGKQRIATELIAGLRTELAHIRRNLLSQAAAVDAAKPSTRLEMVRRAALAQAILHSTMQPMDLKRLAAEIGMSPFRLLSAFQQCFGETPSAYHRKLRLQLALEEAARRNVPVSVISDEFGFAGSSSFSHAYRRAFGHAPVWTRKVA
jgi:AraC-like DNA-binding protein